MFLGFLRKLELFCKFLRSSEEKLLFPDTSENKYFSREKPKFFSKNRIFCSQESEGAKEFSKKCEKRAEI